MLLDSVVSSEMIKRIYWVNSAVLYLWALTPLLCLAGPRDDRWGFHCVFRGRRSLKSVGRSEAGQLLGRVGVAEQLLVLVPCVGRPSYAVDHPNVIVRVRNCVFFLCSSVDHRLPPVDF